MNNQTKYLHKQSARWLLTEETNKLSNDRLLRVMQNRREEFFFSLSTNYILLNKKI